MADDTPLAQLAAQTDFTAAEIMDLLNAEMVRRHDAAVEKARVDILAASREEAQASQARWEVEVGYEIIDPGCCGNCASHKCRSHCANCGDDDRCMRDGADREVRNDGWCPHHERVW